MQPIRWNNLMRFQLIRDPQHTPGFHVIVLRDPPQQCVAGQEDSFLSLLREHQGEAVIEFEPPIRLKYAAARTTIGPGRSRISRSRPRSRVFSAVLRDNHSSSNSGAGMMNV